MTTYEFDINQGGSNKGTPFALFKKKKMYLTFEAFASMLLSISVT